MEKIKHGLLGLSIVAALAAGPSLAQTMPSTSPPAVNPETPTAPGTEGTMADPCSPTDKERNTSGDPKTMPDCSLEKQRGNNKTDPQPPTPQEPTPGQPTPQP